MYKESNVSAYKAQVNSIATPSSKESIPIHKVHKIPALTSSRLNQPIMYTFDIFIRAAVEIQRCYRGYKSRRNYFHELTKGCYPPVKSHYEFTHRFIIPL